MALPWAARAVNRRAPVAAPTVKHTNAHNQPSIGRPFTCTAVTSTTTAHTRLNSSIDSHAWRWIAQKTGSVETDTAANCQARNPKNHPIRSRV